jgi:hypothetical protein
MDLETAGMQLAEKRKPQVVILAADAEETQWLSRAAGESSGRRATRLKGDGSVCVDLSRLLHGDLSR